MQLTIAQQLGLDVSTVANFFMNARRRSVDRWKDEVGKQAGGKPTGQSGQKYVEEDEDDDDDMEEMSDFDLDESSE